MIYRRRAEGAFIKMVRKKEKKTLEKYQAKLITINELIINDNRTDDLKIISDIHFLQNNCDTRSFLNSLQRTCHLNESDIDFCDLKQKSVTVLIF